jgi:hypothetical protein
MYTPEKLPQLDPTKEIKIIEPNSKKPLYLTHCHYLSNGEIICFVRTDENSTFKIHTKEPANFERDSVEYKWHCAMIVQEAASKNALIPVPIKNKSSNISIFRKSITYQL